MSKARSRELVPALLEMAETIQREADYLDKPDSYTSRVLQRDMQQIALSLLTLAKTLASLESASADGIAI